MPKTGERFRAKWVGITVCLLYLVLASAQLGLPGLHYDEAREAGVNAMELLTGAPVSAFRGATMGLAGLDLPLMVQDYIGALNVYLALPFLAGAGIGVPNLRWLSILTGLAALLLLERVISTWLALAQSVQVKRGATPVHWAGVAGICFLAASPSFVFWSRQGIFVTNLTQPLTLLCIWQGLAWWRTGRSGQLWISALAAGCAVYAKLLAIWVVGPFIGLVALSWLVSRQRPRLSISTAMIALFAGILGLIPLLLFNYQTRGTWIALTGNLTQSYYGVDNREILANLAVRWQQVGLMLTGSHLWYLGGIFGNPAAPWLAGLTLILALARGGRTGILPWLLFAAAVGASLFTVSDLFVTHYALLQPLAAGCMAVSLASWAQGVRFPSSWRVLLAALLVALWVTLDLTATLRYHGALARSGGLADHSDASYHLAYYLQHNGLGAPLALDWGMDATVRYLSAGSVRPIEIFGYQDPAQPDADFGERLAQFLPNPDNVYLLRDPASTVFAGRWEIFQAQASALGLRPQLEERFSQRDGAVLFEIWRALPHSVDGSSGQ